MAHQASCMHFVDRTQIREMLRASENTDVLPALLETSKFLELHTGAEDLRKNIVRIQAIPNRQRALRLSLSQILLKRITEELDFDPMHEPLFMLKKAAMKEISTTQAGLPSEPAPSALALLQVIWESKISYPD